MNNKLRSFLDQSAYLPQTLRLVWAAAGGWTLTWTVFLVVQGVLPALQVYLVKPFVDSLVVVIDNGGTWATLRPTLLLALLIAGITVLTQVLQSALNFVRTTQAELIRDYLSGLIHAKSVALDLAYFESAKYHDLMERARSDLGTRPLALLESSGAILQNSITLLAIAGLLMPYGWWLPLVLLVSTLPAFYVLLRFNRRYHRWWEQTTSDRRRTQYIDMLLTHSAVASEMRLFGMGAHFQTAFQSLRKRLRQEQIALTRDQSLARLGAGFLSVLISGVAMLWIVWQAMQGWLTLGDLTLFYQSFNRGQGLLRTLLDNLGQIYSNTLFLGNLFEFLALESNMADPAEPAQPPAALRQAIRYENVSFSYPDSERLVFDNFNLTIPAGKVVAIVGANGVGKTTLIKLLCRLYDPAAGSITLDGVDIRRLALKDVRRLITVMFQFPVPYFSSAAENILLGDLTAAPDPAQIEAAARSAGADTFIDRLPQRYQTPLGKWFANGVDLSGGEWQRLALARAFFRQAQIMILDEPTSLLDSWSEIDWFDRFRQLANGRTAIIITHRFTIAKDADIIYVMDQGRVAEAGTHAELIAKNGLYAVSWAAQVEKAASNPEPDNDEPQPMLASLPAFAPALAGPNHRQSLD